MKQKLYYMKIYKTKTNYMKKKIRLKNVIHLFKKACSQALL